MADIVVRAIETKDQTTVQKDSSSGRQAAKKVGINVPKTHPSLPEVEQEATDID